MDMQYSVHDKDSMSAQCLSQHFFSTELLDMLREWQASDRPCAYVCCVAGGYVIGIALLIKMPELCAWHIVYIYVARQYRLNGMARRMLSYISNYNLLLTCNKVATVDKFCVATGFILQKTTNNNTGYYMRRGGTALIGATGSDGQLGGRTTRLKSPTYKA